MPTDQHKLQIFLDQVESTLDKAINKEHHLIRAEMQPFFVSAWNEIAPSFVRMRAAVGNLSNDALDDLGLSGAQLSLKLEGHRRAVEALEAVPGWTDRLLKKVLRWINILLGSMKVALPILEPLKELKESYEAELDE